MSFLLDPNTTIVTTTTTTGYFGTISTTPSADSTKGYDEDYITEDDDENLPQSSSSLIEEEVVLDEDDDDETTTSCGDSNQETTKEGSLPDWLDWPISPIREPTSSRRQLLFNTQDITVGDPDATLTLPDTSPTTTATIKSKRYNSFSTRPGGISKSSVNKMWTSSRKRRKPSNYATAYNNYQKQLYPKPTISNSCCVNDRVWIKFTYVDECKNYGKALYDGIVRSVDKPYQRVYVDFYDGDGAWVPLKYVVQNDGKKTPRRKQIPNTFMGR